MTDVIFSGVIVGVIVGVVTTVVQLLLNYQTDRKIAMQSERITKLEDEKISKLEQRDDRLAEEIHLGDKLLADKVQSSIDYGVEGRQKIHERLNNDMVTRREWGQFTSQVSTDLGEIKQAIRAAVLDAAQAGRDVAKVEGKIEALKNAGRAS